MVSDYNTMLLTLILLPVTALCLNIAKHATKVQKGKLQLNKISKAMFTDLFVVAALVNTYAVVFAFSANLQYQL